MTTSMLRRIARLEAMRAPAVRHVVTLIDDGVTDIAAAEARHVAELGPAVSFIIMRIVDPPSRERMQ